MQPGFAEDRPFLELEELVGRVPIFGEVQLLCHCWDGFFERCFDDACSASGEACEQANPFANVLDPAGHDEGDTASDSEDNDSSDSWGQHVLSGTWQKCVHL